MTVFSDMVDAMFASPVAQDATYTPPGGSAASIRVVPVTGDDIEAFGLSRIKIDGRAIFDTPKSGLEGPEKGGTVTFSGADYTVKYFTSRDDDRLIWTLECYPAD